MLVTNYQFSFVTNTWVDLPNLGIPLMGHTMNILPDKSGLIIFGGKTSNDSLSNTLWYFNFNTSQWDTKATKSLIKR